MLSMTWWETDEWHAYESAYGDEPGTRARLLQTAAWQTIVVDLRQDPVTLWRDVRRSYKSLIHRADRDYSIMWWADGTPYNWRWMRECQALHRAASGRTTRPDETWSIMANWLNDGHGLLMAALTPASEWQAFAYFVIADRWAYYFSAAALIDNLAHALIWNAINVLHYRGVERLELGWQGEATDAKGRQIEFFRRGFGGTLVSPLEAATCA